ncbi:MAG: DegT/DnrJ/EryC1/StrS family aminotransferase [Chloroflexi bacterium]|nr:DegT/DnrJ/EryC1/StrS family aminotransferase [Chloroflexota bacterium]
MSEPDITQVEIDAVNRVLQTPHLSIGPVIDEFEHAWARFVGARYAVGVSSGTAGLHCAVIAAGVGAGDEVITTPFSFVASANVMLYQNATPIFADIDSQTLNIDPNQVEDKIKSRLRAGARFKAIMPVHVFHQPCDMDPLMEIAARYDLLVIEDACEAMGAQYNGRAVGTFGKAAVFAFYPNKQMTTGEGGMIVTDDTEWAQLFRSLRNQGRDENGTWLHHIRLGYNYRLDELSAALGLAQLSRIDELLEKRERVAQMYNARLRGMPGVQIPFIAPQTTRSSWFVYVVRIASEIDRDAVLRELAARGIPARPYFTPIHLQPFYRTRFGFQEGDFPITEQVARTTLALPFHSNLNAEKIDFIGETLSQILDSRRSLQ